MITGHDIGMALRSAYWSMHRRADANFGQAGVTADQFVLLAALAQAAERDGPDGITQQELVRRTASDPSTVRAMLVLLEGRRLVARRRHPTDGRARSVSITEKGKRIFEGSQKPGSLKLLDHFVSDSGVIFTTYEPA